MPRLFFPIYIIIFSSRLGFQATQPLVSLHLKNLGVEPGTIGLLLGAAGVVPVILASVFGRLTDRFGSRRQVVFGGLLSALGYAMLGFTTSPISVICYLAIAWLGAFATTLAYQSFIANHDLAGDRVQPFAWLGAAVSLANSLAPAAAGLIADFYNLKTVFMFSAVVSSTSLLGLPLLTGQIVPQSTSQSSSRSSGENKGTWINNREFVFTIGAVLLTGVVAGIRNSFFPLHLSNIGYCTTEIGLLLSIQAASGILLQSQLGRITERYDPARMVIIAFVLSTVALGVVPLQTHFVVLIGPMILLGISGGILHPVTMAMAADAVPDGQQGTALGLRYTFLRLGNMGSPIVFGVVASIAGLPATFFAAALLSGIGAVGGFFFFSGSSRAG